MSKFQLKETTREGDPYKHYVIIHNEFNCVYGEIKYNAMEKKMGLYTWRNMNYTLTELKDIIQLLESINNDNY